MDAIAGGIIGWLTAADRLPNTPSGNPRWRLTLGGCFIYTTADDSQCAMSVSPYDVGQEVTLRLNREGQVIYYDHGYPSRCYTCGDLITRCVGH